MSSVFHNIKISGCAVGIEIPKDAGIFVSNLEVVDTEQAILVRDSPSLLQTLGLPDNTPHEHLVELLQLLKANQGRSSIELAESLRETKLLKFLGVTADLTGLASTFISPQAVGILTAILSGGSV